MSGTYSDAVVTAIRNAIADTGPPASIDPGLALQQSVEATLFDLGAIAPVESTRERALQAIATAGECDDAVLHARWTEAVQSQAARFANDPSAWDDIQSVEFLDRCATVFGVETSRVPELIQRFHGLSEGARNGIFLLIERSTVFSYLTREIDADRSSRPLEDPGESFKKLIRQIVESTE